MATFAQVRRFSLKVHAAVIPILQEDLQGELARWHLDGARAAAGEAAWRALEAKTSPLAQELCEQLRLILEATVASKMEGDYRSGKRISMRKVIPYIASGFRKDKIWLRRMKPSKRQYQARAPASLGNHVSICALLPHTAPSLFGR